jgi:hypothetical protein
METTKTASDEFASKVARNLALGVLIMFAITAGGCIIAGIEPFVAMGVAALPSLVAGPFIGGMITVAAYRDESH